MKPLEASRITSNGAELSASDYELEFISTMRGWHKLEQGSKSGIEIVDFDLVEIEGEHTYGSRNEVIHSLETLKSSEKYKSIDPAFKEKISASLSFANALVAGATDVDEFLQTTQFVNSNLIPEKILTQYANDCRRLLEKNGYSFTREGYDEFLENETVSDPASIKSLIFDNVSYWEKSVKDAIGFHEPIESTVDFVDFNQPWQVGVQGHYRTGISVAINLHNRHRFLRGQCQYLGSHEIAGHAIQFGVRQALITRGILRPYCGIVTTFNPDMAVSEGLCQTIPYFFANDDDLPGSFLVTKKTPRTSRLHHSQCSHDGGERPIYKRLRRLLS